MYTSLTGEKVALHAEGETLVFDDLGITLVLDERDILAENGVGHSLSSVPIPHSVVITPKNLINATGSKSWLEILQTHNLTEYLDLHTNHTLLIPTDVAITSSPLDSLNAETIKSVIDFHIIPPINGKPVDLLSENPILPHTLSGHTISTHKIYTDTWIIQFNTSSARILDQGKTSNGGQVLLIDSVLFEPTVGEKWSWAKPIAVVIVAVAMSVIVASIVSLGVQRWQRRKGTKPLFHGEDDDESEPFLNGTA
jgi:Fasciclin domain